jgi:hypothetical protein
VSNTQRPGQLSSHGLANLVVNDTDSVFVVNDDEVACSRFQAQFISPKVANLLRSDSAIDRFDINIKNVSTATALLSSLMERGEFDVSLVSTVADLARALGNTELLEVCLRSTSDRADENNVLQRLNVLPIEEDLCFMASHFSSVSEHPEIGSLGSDLLSRVLSHPALYLESEDSLFRFIERLSSEDESYRVLIDFVEAQYLSDSCIRNYISFVDSDQLSVSVWHSIRRRLSAHLTSR